MLLKKTRTLFICASKQKTKDTRASQDSHTQQAIFYSHSEWTRPTYKRLQLAPVNTHLSCALFGGGASFPLLVCASPRSHCACVCMETCGRSQCNLEQLASIARPCRGLIDTTNGQNTIVQRHYFQCPNLNQPKQFCFLPLTYRSQGLNGTSYCATKNDDRSMSVCPLRSRYSKKPRASGLMLHLESVQGKSRSIKTNACAKSLQRHET